ncbi:hypothetical protein N6G02_10620 [Cupriavidus gilardii]|uniref:Uncharacterized protein n=1 Tax=Cupriavidus gilardii TaxID=82541 RepID=A0A6N1BHZ8_9BURK|nr:hypothetical protein [Cupriavidus gilardii]ALD89625.1 membrane protein [Cupriavidus gilardii CR3]KAB0598968.1 hypothetical protein F7Q96_05525 [Cupriavidus gilardii]MCT9016961.1 hypothetical protein [Cupriavidus gilardii]MCT9056613.1 hypothetical protein [Cupriavidus gilardii]MCT9073861.1 hypothetical protein [Cupriavidus gilardii]
MTLDIELIRQFLLQHAETILTWLVAGLVMMLLARFELRRAVRKSAQAMSESVATTVAACVPDIAHAAQVGSAAAEGGAVQMQRAEALRRVALDTVAAVMARGRWLEEVGNLRLPEDALLPGRRGSGADPLLVVAPQPVVQAYLAAQRTFETMAAQLQARRRDALALQDAAQALVAEAAQIEQETASIVLRFEQVNAQAAQAPQGEGGDYQRFLIQKYHALGQREKEVAQARTEMQARAAQAAEALATEAHAAAARYTESLAPLMQQLRAAWGHGDSPDVFDSWVREASVREERA